MTGKISASNGLARFVIDQGPECLNRSLIQVCRGGSNGLVRDALRDGVTDAHGESDHGEHEGHLNDRQRLVLIKYAER